MPDPFLRDPLSLPVWADDAMPFESGDDQAARADEKPVAKEDDCVPVKPEPPKPKAAKRSVFAEGAARPESKPASEQATATRKRLAPPAIVKPRTAPDC
jgi:hypothetical protein